MRVILAEPRGFCAGVVRAIDIVELALKKYGPPVYVRHEIVHNKRVVENLKAKGAIFVEEVDEVPERGAHGLQRAWRVAEGRRYGAAARPAGDRRDLSAGRQGAQGRPALFARPITR